MCIIFQIIINSFCLSQPPSNDISDTVKKNSEIFTWIEIGLPFASCIMKIKWIAVWNRYGQHFFLLLFIFSQSPQLYFQLCSAYSSCVNREQIVVFTVKSTIHPFSVHFIANYILRFFSSSSSIFCHIIAFRDGNKKESEQPSHSFEVLMVKCVHKMSRLEKIKFMFWRHTIQRIIIHVHCV